MVQERNLSLVTGTEWKFGRQMEKMTRFERGLHSGRMHLELAVTQELAVIPLRKRQKEGVS